MTEEIKEILECFSSDDIHLIQCEHKWCDAYGYEKSQMKKDLLYYITNLQQENERLKEVINDDMSVYLKGLEDGKEKMKECYDSVYKSRCLKAIEYLKECKELEFSELDVLNILNGSDEK